MFEMVMPVAGDDVVILMEEGATLFPREIHGPSSENAQSHRHLFVEPQSIIKQESEDRGYVLSSCSPLDTNFFHLDRLLSLASQFVFANILLRPCQFHQAPSYH